MDSRKDKGNTDKGMDNFIYDMMLSVLAERSLKSFKILTLGIVV